MAVHIEEDISGRIILDISGERDLADNANFSDIILAFSVVSQTPSRLVLDLGGPVMDSIVYLQQGLEDIGVTVTLSEELATMVDRARAEINLVEEIRRSYTSDRINQSIADIPVVPDLDPSASLLIHQNRGLMQGLNINNLAEFSVQGSGKTAVVLSAFSIWKDRGEIDKLLVIGPISCFVPWEDEVHRCFGRKMQTLRWSGAVSQRLRLVPRFGVVDIILCSYDTARRDVLMLRRLLKDSRTLLVLDESHYIKNINIGARATSAIQIAPYAAKRMILTGTPAPHSMQDLWTQLAFLWPNASRVLLGSTIEFQDFLYSSPTPARELRQRLAPFYHRTTQGELNLPAPQTHFIRIPMNDIPIEQQRLIQLLDFRILSEARLQLPNITDRQVLAQWQRARIIRLLQVASNPGLLQNRPDWPTDIVGDVDTSDLLKDVTRFQNRELVAAKIAWTADKVQELIQQGNKVVVWTWWVNNLHLLKDILAEHNPLLLYGAIKPYEEETDEEGEQSREKNIKEFKSRDDRPVLLANPAACAEAISLHVECHHAIYIDRTFNCGQFLQSLNRIHRVGLPEGITTHYWIPIIECAVEHVVDNRLQERQRLMYEFLGDETPVLGIDIGEETEVSDSNEELNQDFLEIIREIDNGHQGESTT